MVCSFATIDPGIVMADGIMAMVIKVAANAVVMVVHPVARIEIET